MSRRGSYLTRVRLLRHTLTEQQVQTVLNCSGFEPTPPVKPPPAPRRCRGCGAPDALPDGYCKWCDRGRP